MFKKKNNQQQNSAFGHFEAETSITLLPRCANCSAPHPLARKPVPEDTSKCPDCGSNTYIGRTQISESAITGKGLWFAGVLFGIGKYLRNLANRE